MRGRKAPKGTQTGESLRVLDLFSGTGSVSRVFVDEGYEVVSLDIDPKFNPTIVADVLERTSRQRTRLATLMWFSRARLATR